MAVGLPRGDRDHFMADGVVSDPLIGDPVLPEGITGNELDAEVRSELSTLSAQGRVAVSKHLVAAGRLLDVDPDIAYRHAVAARRRAGRIAAVREAAGLTAYAAGHHAEALRELRTVRRLTGSAGHLALMADCERALGRPERALEIGSTTDAARLRGEAATELAMVVAGARLDLGQPDAAVALLERRPELRSRPSTATARLWSAYADALAAAGRAKESQVWAQRARTASSSDAREGAPDPDLGDVVVVDLLDEEILEARHPGVTHTRPRR